MKSKIASFILALFTFLFLKTTAFAQESELITNDPATIQDLVLVFKNVLLFVIVIGGFAAFLMLIAGGFRFLTAQGDQKATAAARSTITWAVLGLAFIIFSWLIISFLADFTGVPLTTFCIPEFDSTAYNSTKFCPGLGF